MLLGVIFIAAGVTNTIGHAAEPLATGPAAALAVGVLFYLAGDSAFRRTLGMWSGVVRAAAAVVALGTIPLGWSSAALQLVTLVAVFAGVFRMEVVVVGANGATPPRPVARQAHRDRPSRPEISRLQRDRHAFPLHRPGYLFAIPRRNE
jgi:hypothetical protein